jgi:hypothetical protein
MNSNFHLHGISFHPVSLCTFHVNAIDNRKIYQQSYRYGVNYQIRVVVVQS